MRRRRSEMYYKRGSKNVEKHDDNVEDLTDTAIGFLREVRKIIESAERTYNSGRTPNWEVQGKRTQPPQGQSGMSFEEACDILGVKEDVTEDELKAAYRVLAKKYHPDLNHGNKEESESLFKNLNNAMSYIRNYFS